MLGEILDRLKMLDRKIDILGLRRTLPTPRLSGRGDRRVAQYGIRPLHVQKLYMLTLRY